MGFVRVTGHGQSEGRPSMSLTMSFATQKSQIVTHNLQTLSPFIVCYTNNRRIDPANITIIDDNSFRVTFNTAESVKIEVH